MGTTKCERYLNTQGGAKSICEYALVHSEEGSFRWRAPDDVHRGGHGTNRIRLASGGHGEKGRLLLDKYHIEYKINKIYSNGVRTGSVSDHVHRSKRGDHGQSWFPENWSLKNIRKAGEYVVKLEGNKLVADGATIFGTYRGVRVGVIRTNGKIATIFPDRNQDESEDMTKK